MSARQLIGGALLGAIVHSEVQFHAQKRAAGPVNEKIHHLAYEITEGTGETFVCLHGWPDDPRLWSKCAQERLSRTQKAFVVNCSLPGYPLPSGWNGVKENVPGGAARTYGFDFAEAADLLRATIIRATADRPGGRITLMIHDWGCVVGYLFVAKYPEMVNRIVAVDVGCIKERNNPIGAVAGVSYQSILNLAYMLPTPIGDALTRAMGVALMRTPAEGAGQPTAAMNWPYRATFRDALTLGPVYNMLWFEPIKGIPFLFVYGTDPPESLRFSDKTWNALVEASHPTSRVVGMPGNHWCQNSSPDLFCDIVDKFISESASSLARIGGGAKL